MEFHPSFDLTRRNVVTTRFQTLRQFFRTAEHTDRLTSETVAADPNNVNGSVTYTYDAVGNRHYLKQRADRSHGAPLPEEKRKGRLKKKGGNKPQFDLRTGLFRMSGTDLTRVDGIDVITATTILSEAGWDMSKWVTEDHFVSWLRLCPDNRISGKQSHWERAAAHQQQGDHRFKDGGQHLATKRYLSGCAVPSIQN